MTLLMDVLTALAAIAFVIALFSVADRMYKGDDDDYNSERGIQEDQHPGGFTYESENCQGTTGRSTSRVEP